MKIARMALLVWMAGAVAHGGETQQKLTVYMEVGTADRHMIIRLAEQLADRMFAGIGISLEWKSGERAGNSSQPPIIIEVASETPGDYRPDALAYAQPYEGSHIKVFLDRIEGLEYPGNVLAHVIVHEITHILQGTSRHSATGVMKAHWTGRDFCEMRHRPLPFAREDVDLIYDGLSARRGVTSDARVSIEEHSPRVGVPGDRIAAAPPSDSSR